MVDAVSEVLSRMEQQEEPEVPENILAHELLQMTYRGQIRPSPQQMRAAIESLPYETPKLSATAIATMDGSSFAEALERALVRSETVRSRPALPPPVIDATVIDAAPEISVAEMKQPFATYRRFARR